MPFPFQLCVARSVGAPWGSPPASRSATSNTLCLPLYSGLIGVVVACDMLSFPSFCLPCILLALPSCLSFSVISSLLSISYSPPLSPRDGSGWGTFALIFVSSHLYPYISYRNFLQQLHTLHTYTQVWLVAATLTHAPAHTHGMRGQIIHQPPPPSLPLLRSLYALYLSLFHCTPSPSSLPPLSLSGGWRDGWSGPRSMVSPVPNAIWPIQGVLSLII